MQCTLFDSNDGVALGTSSVPVAVFKPHKSNTTSTEQRYINYCFNFLTEYLSAVKSEILASGLYQVVASTSGYKHSVFWQTGNAVNSLQNAATIFCADAGAANPASLCRHWVSHPNIECHFSQSIQFIVRDGDSWLVKDDQNKTVGRGDLIILTNAMTVTRFIPELSLTPVSGQISQFKNNQRGPVICSNGCIVRTKNGVWSGATFHRYVDTRSLSEADDLVNLQRLRHLAGIHNPDRLQSWSGVRYTTPDRLPVVGPVPDYGYYRRAYCDLHHGKNRQYYPPARYQPGLYVLTGLGSQGLLQALFSAECLADSVFGRCQIDESIKRSIHPARFILRMLRRTRTHTARR